MGQVSSTYHLVCMWRVEMKRENSIKEKGAMRERDRKFVRESTIAT